VGAKLQAGGVLQNPVFAAVVTAVVVGGAGVGWVASAPLASPGLAYQPMHRTLTATFHPVDPNAGQTPRAADQGPEADNRERLRQAVIGWAAALRANPCDDQTKARFLSATQAYMGPFMRAQRASASESGPAEWRTAGDQLVSEAFRDMPEQGYVDPAEFLRTMAAATPQGRLAIMAKISGIPEAQPGPTPACRRYQTGQPADARTPAFHTVQRRAP
jgi:hypothetical protein